MTTSLSIYKPTDIEEVIKITRPYYRFARNRKIRYFDVPSAYDIETSSFYYRGSKCACMYEWTFGLFGLVIIGRTWEEFLFLIQEITRILDLNSEKRLIIYVHNLSYEFQFMRKYFEWENVFALERYKPIYALTTTGIEFRCSYLLSGYSLAKTAENLKTFQIQKMVGDLDYDKIRHSRTPLTQEEILYCVEDVRIVMADIAERIMQLGDIARLPLTKTGYVRNFIRGCCFGTTEL